MPEVLSYNPSAREGEYAPVTPTQQRQIIFKPNVENGSCRSISLPFHSRTGECTSDPGVFSIIIIILPYRWLSYNKNSLHLYQGDCTSDPGVSTIIIIISPFWWLSCNKHSLHPAAEVQESSLSLTSF